jgi:hypothetical protein
MLSRVFRVAAIVLRSRPMFDFNADVRQRHEASEQISIATRLACMRNGEANLLEKRPAIP